MYAEGLLRVKGDYTTFLEGKEQYLEAQSKLQDALKNRVKIETRLAAPRSEGSDDQVEGADR